MVIKLPFTLTKTQIGLLLSVLLNLLGLTGTVQPLVGGELPDCPPQTVTMPPGSAVAPSAAPAAPSAAPEPEN